MSNKPHTVPLFDSLTHPMHDGSWLKSGNSSNTFEHLIEEMNAAGVKDAICTGLGDATCGYSVERYADEVRSASEHLHPLAFLDFNKFESLSALTVFLDRVSQLGYTGVKIHPRLSGITFSHDWLPSAIAEANRRNLTVFLCTYLGSGSQLTLRDLAIALDSVESPRVVLLHGGGVKLLEASELVRNNPSVLLDLSFTLCKYPGSSIDADIQFLFSHFDRRICIGSDSPEFSLQQFRTRFEHFAEGLPIDKVQNIGHRNLSRFLSFEAP